MPLPIGGRIQETFILYLEVVGYQDRYIVEKQSLNCHCHPRAAVLGLWRVGNYGEGNIRIGLRDPTPQDEDCIPSDFGLDLQRHLT